jgi:hypothetical protein
MYALLPYVQNINWCSLFGKQSVSSQKFQIELKYLLLAIYTKALKKCPQKKLAHKCL